MRNYYKPCSKCGANLDPGEKCDCTTLVMSETFMIEFDLARGSSPVMTVIDPYGREGSRVINIHHGLHAEKLYTKLTGREIKKEEKKRVQETWNRDQ